MCREAFMKRALTLARQGLGQVEPNPAVGCVIVRDGRIIGEGFHEIFGGPHAEVNALADCRRKGNDPAGADLYVTLEPCCHTGKTGPCTEALIEAQIRRVICAAGDPTAKVCERGIQRLREAQIEVECGLCEQEALSLNAPFYKHARTGRPWVILKWAQSLDGKLARRNPPDRGWISNASSRRNVHRTRKKVQAVLTGIRTVLADNPMLTVRLEGETVRRPPLRVVLDSRLQIIGDSHPVSPDLHLLSPAEAPTLLIATEAAFASHPEKVETLREAGIDVAAVSADEGRCDLSAILDLLGGRDIQQVLVEAGPALLTEFLRQDLADEVQIYIAPCLLGADGIADLTDRLGALPEIRLDDPQVRSFDGDLLVTGRLH